MGLLDRQPTLTGDTLLLRPLSTDDHDGLWTVASDPLLWEQHPSKERATPAGFERWFTDALASAGALTVLDRRSGQTVGTSRYVHRDPEPDRVEIGWTFVDRARWGGPTNQEMKRLMIDHALAALPVVVFRVHEHNRRSQRAVEKLGAPFTRFEDDPAGRGRNLVYELDRRTWVACRS